MGERLLVYSALAMLCALTATFAGAAAAAWSYLQIVAVIELIYWIAGPAGKQTARHG